MSGVENGIPAARARNAWGMSRRIISGVVCMLALILAGGAAHAEGSRTLFPLGYFAGEAGNANPGAARSQLMYHASNVYMGTVRQRNFLYVYAEPGEYILLGTSGARSGLRLYTPVSVDNDAETLEQRFGVPGLEDHTVVAAGGGEIDRSAGGRQILGCAGAGGNIGSRDAELAGPNSVDGTGTVPNGYAPCHYLVPPGEGGIYGVFFGTSSLDMWDVTVRADASSTADVTGRLFSYSFAGNTTGATNGTYATHYYVTDDGYRYSQVMRGLAPFQYVLYSNSAGFLDHEDNPLYRNVRGDSHWLNSLEAGSYFRPTGTGIQAQQPQYPMFFGDVMTASGLAATLDALGIPLMPDDPEVRTVSFSGSHTDSETTYVGQGGVFTIETRNAMTYQIVIRGGDTPAHDDPAHPDNRVLTGSVTGSADPDGWVQQTVRWDGLNNAGTPVPASVATYGFEVSGRAGEVHFPFLDAEANLNGGPTVTRLNGVGSGDATVYYDDRGYTTNGVDVGTPGGHICGGTPGAGNEQPTPTHSLTGIDSGDADLNGSGRYYRYWGVTHIGNSGSDCAVNGYYGDAKGMDLWAYIRSEPPLELPSLRILDAADVTVTAAIPASVAPGGTVVLVASFGNVGSATANDTTYRVELPADLDGGVSCAGATCSYDPATGLVTITGLPTSLSPGQWTNPVTLEYTAPASGDVPVEVGVTTSSAQPIPDVMPDAVSGTTLVDAGVTGADLLAQLDPPPVAAPGEAVHVTASFRNLGPASASGITAGFTLPAGLAGVTCAPLPVSCDYDDVTGAVDVTGLPGTLDAGGSMVLTLSYTAPPSGSVPVTAVIDADTADPNPGNNTATAYTTVSTVPSADLTASVAPPSQVTSGDTVSVPVSFRNLGPQAAAGVSYSVILSPGLSGVGCSAPVVCDYDATTGALTLLGGVPGTLANGQIVGFTVSYTAPTPGTVSFSASVGSAVTDDDNPANNSASAETAIMPGTHTVSFDSNGGTPVDDLENVTHGDTVDAPDAPTRVGHVFTGWYADPGLTVPWDFDTDTVTDSITLYAGWEAVIYALSYAAGPGGSIGGASAQLVAHGQDGTLVTAIAAPGHVFHRWSDGVLTAGRQETGVTANLSLTALFASTEEHTLELGEEHDFAQPDGSTISHFRRVRGGQETSLDNPDPADYAGIIECSAGVCRFLAHRSGRYELTLVDGDGNARIITFIVHPNVGFATERQVSSQGVETTVRVVLDDLPVEETVRVAYSVQNEAVVGAPQPADLLSRDPRELLMDVGAGGNLTCFEAGHCHKEFVFTPTAASGEIGFRLHDSDGVVIGDYQTHVVELVPQGLVPLTADLDVRPGRTVSAGTPAEVEVIGLPPGNYDFDWSGSDGVLGIGGEDDGLVFPDTTTPGDYEIRVIVRDADDPNRDPIELRTWLRVIAPGDEDDHCGEDGCEDDGSGIPEGSLDPACGPGATDPAGIPHRLQIGDRGWTWDTAGLCLETLPGYGLRLGTVAHLASPGFGAGVDQDAVRRFGNDGREGTNTADRLYTHRGIQYDFEIARLDTAGQSAPVVVPLPRNLSIPAAAVWRHYHPVDGWSGFVEDARNTLHSAPRIGGQCPSPVSPLWDENPGLVEGLDCVRLVIEDGGLNDADRQANGVIRHLGALGVSAGGHKITSSGPGGGGAMSPLALLGAGLLALAGLRRARRAWIITACVALLALASPAGADDEEIRTPGWFVGATAGLAMGEVGGSDVTRGLADHGIDAAARVKDKDRFAWRLFGGYRFGRHLSLEGGYTNLGLVTTYVTGAPVDLDDIPGVLPASGAGWELGLTGYLPMGERVDLYGRLGAWRWETLYHVHETGQKRRPKASGVDMLGGLGLRYWHDHRWQAGLGWDRYRVDGQDVDMLGLSVVYQFGSERRASEPPPAMVVAAPAAAPPVPPVIVPPVQASPPVVLPRWTVNFAFDSAALHGAGGTLDEAAAFLTANPRYLVAVTGHTDLTGGGDYNLRLSQRRAQAVADGLVARGVDAERVRVSARGLNEPVAGDLSPEGRAADRRVEIAPLEE